MTDDNRLAGMACPTCSQHANFQIHAAADFDVTGDYQGVEWDANNAIRCPKGCEAVAYTNSRHAKPT